MAEHRTKEELLREIGNRESGNENYKKFKASLEVLNREIDTLMKPGAEGWKLLDEETFVPLYERYMKTAKSLSSYLYETRKSVDPDEKSLREVCNAFRSFFLNDMETMRKYRADRTGEMKSLPTLMEEARVQTVSLYNQNVDMQSGAMNERMPMKVFGKEGQEIDGFFTKAVYYKPLESVQEVLDRAAEKAADPKGAQILRGFTALVRARHRALGLPEEQDAGTLWNILKKTCKADGIHKPEILPGPFIELCYSLIQKVEKDTFSRITGIPERDIPANENALKSAFGKKSLTRIGSELAMVWNNVGNTMDAAISENTRIDTRNVAMTNVAELLGMPGIVCESRMLRVRDGAGNMTDGIFMAKAKGVDANCPGPGYGYVSSEHLKKGDRHVLKQLADLQVLDYICGNIDRHGANIFYEFDENGELVGIQGIDNDLSFGKLTDKEKSVGYMMTPDRMKVISKSTADRILSLDPDQLAYTLCGVLGKDEVEAACTRLGYMKDKILESRQLLAGNGINNEGKGILYEVKDNEWANVNPDKLTKVDKTSRKTKGKNIFAEVKETLDDFSRMSQIHMEKVSYRTANGINRATTEGIASRLKKTIELHRLLNRRTGVQGTSENYQNVQAALIKHVALLKKIYGRIRDCSDKVKKGTAAPEEYFGKYVTKEDMVKIRASEESLRAAASRYNKDKLNELRRDHKTLEKAGTYTRNRIEAIREVLDFTGNGKGNTPEEEESVKANHRKAVEEIVRAIRKDPESRAAGVKTEIGKSVKTTKPVKNMKSAKSMRKEATVPRV